MYFKCKSLSSTMISLHYTIPDCDPDPPPAPAAPPLSSPKRVLLMRAGACMAPARIPWVTSEDMAASACFFAPFLHLMKPMRLIPFSVSATTTMRSQAMLNLRIPTTRSTAQRTGESHIPPQNIVESTLLIILVSGVASYSHTLEPSSRNLLVHRRPTRRRPVTFFVVQKSKEIRRNQKQLRRSQRN